MNNPPSADSTLLSSLIAVTSISTDPLPTELSLRAALGATLSTCSAEDSFEFLLAEGGLVKGRFRDGVTTGGELVKQVGGAGGGGGSREEGGKVVLEFVVVGGERDREGKTGSSAELLITANFNGTILNLNLFYSPTRFTPTSSHLFLHHLSLAFSSIQYFPSAPISLLSPSEIAHLKQLAKSGEATAKLSSYPDCSSLKDIILQAAKSTPNAIALSFSPSPSAPSLDFTYSQLIRLSSCFATLLPSSSAGGSKIIPLCLPKSLIQIIVLLAVVLAGHGYLNLETSLPNERKEGILRDLKRDGGEIWSGFGVVDKSESEVWSKWKDGAESLVETIDPEEFLGGLLNRFPRAEEDWKTVEGFPNPTDNDVAYIITTSGSTGTPKSILVEQRNVVAFLRNYRGVFGRKEGERVLGFPSYGFDVMVVNIWDTLAHSATFCLSTPEELYGNLSATIIAQKITIVDITPTISSILFDHPILPSESIKESWRRAGYKIWRVNTGGEKIEGWVRDKWVERGVEVVIDYGPSESTVGIISNQRASRTPLPIGLPTGSNHVFLLSTFSEEIPLLVPLGCIGEICVIGDQVSRGYLRKELNEGVFFEWEGEKCYRTGDLGRWSDFGCDGEWEIVFEGRRDGMVKINGLRIEIGEIESHLNSKAHPNLTRGIVDRLEKLGLAPGLVAFLSVTNNFEQVVESVKTYLKEKVPAYMVPRYFIPVKEIPTMGMGKTDRKSLRKLAEGWDFKISGKEAAGEIDEDEGDDDECSKTVRDAWAKVLRIQPGDISSKSVFTMMGGDSVGFLKVVGMVSKGLNIRIGWKELVDTEFFREFVEVARKFWVNREARREGEDGKVYEKFSLVAKEVRKAVANLLGIDTEDIDDILPTAPSQDAILAAAVDSTHYYAQAVYDVHEEVGDEVLGRALRELVGRNELLRTVFVIREEERRILQAVLRDGCKVVQDHATLEMVESGPEKLDRWLEGDRADHIFAWGRLALRFALFRFSDGSRQLVWAMHHAMSDGWTLELLMTDLRALCYSLPLRPRPPFASYVAWWQSRPPIFSISSLQEFWSSYIPPSTSFDFPSITSLNSELLCTSASSTQHWQGNLPDFSKKYGITPAIISRLAISLALAKHSKSNEVVVGIVRSGRDVDVLEAEEIVGPCVSVLPSRFIVDLESSLENLLKLELIADRKCGSNQQVTLGELGKICGDGSRFRILVTYQSLAERDEENETVGLPWPIRQPPRRIEMPSNYALSFEITPELEDKTKLEFSCFFDERVLREDEVAAILKSVREMMDTIIRKPKSSLSSLGFKTSSPWLSTTTSARPPSPKINDNHFNPTSSSPNRGATIEVLRSSWAQVLGVPAEQVGFDDTFCSLGGDSVGMMRLSVILKRARVIIPIVVLSRLATIGAQANWYDNKTTLTH